MWGWYIVMSYMHGVQMQQPGGVLNLYVGLGPEIGRGVMSAALMLMVCNACMGVGRLDWHDPRSSSIRGLRWSMDVAVLHAPK